MPGNTGVAFGARLTAFSVDSRQSSWQGMLGYRINSHWAMELDYSHISAAKVTAISNGQILLPTLVTVPVRIVQDISSEIRGPSVTGLGILPLGRRLELFLRAGIFFADRRLMQFYSTGPTERVDSTETWLTGVGAAWSFTNHWSGRLEYLRSGHLKPNEQLGEGWVSQTSVGVVWRAGAREHDSTKSLTASGFYVGAALGRVHQDADPGTPPVIVITSGPCFFSAIPEQLASFSIASSQSSWQGMLGYRISPHWAAEFAYVHTGAAQVRASYTWPVLPPPVTAPVALGPTTLEIASEVHGPSLSGLAILPVSRRWELFLRGGMWFADRKVTEFYLTTPYERVDGTETWLSGVGADWRATSNWSVRLEYQRSGNLKAVDPLGVGKVSEASVGVTWRGW